MLTQEIQSLFAYSQQLHRGEWCISRLPDQLGAKQLDREVEPQLLGVAAQGPRRRAIGVNSLVRGTPLEIPVLAHECAHLLLGHSLGYCLPGARGGRQERDAWIGAAILSVPYVEAADEPWLLHACHVPRELLALRYELKHGRPTGKPFQHLQDWVLRVASEIDLPRIGA